MACRPVNTCGSTARNRPLRAYFWNFKKDSASIGQRQCFRGPTEALSFFGPFWTMIFLAQTGVFRYPILLGHVSNITWPCIQYYLAMYYWMLKPLKTSHFVEENKEQLKANGAMHMRQREFDEFHFMCTALLLPNCRDAFLRLSQLPSLRDRRFYSAILLAETQECVSTTFRRTQR